MGRRGDTARYTIPGGLSPRPRVSVSPRPYRVSYCTRRPPVHIFSGNPQVIPRFTAGLYANEAVPYGVQGVWTTLWH